ncbi:MAG: elongation factor 4 [Actinobacteria bacterium]|nr:elongation factor 4 [Actinomycetota bacterium]
MPAIPSGKAPQPSQTNPEQIRNFCIIAHIDHGKSTLADRMLGITGVVEARNMREQYLDRMDIERERGITIKSQAVRLPWKSGIDGKEYILNMIDTPGHVDFTYEVSRSLAACEGAILLVDCAQGIEAQTLANLYLAMENDLTIIPVLNKIDLPAAQPEKFAIELSKLVGCKPEDCMRVSGKTGEGVEELLDQIVAQLPPPKGDPHAPARALIFDSVYDTYRGVVTYVRVVDGKLSPREQIQMVSTGVKHELLDIGFGFRCGFLGLLHMEIVRERLEREFNLSLISTAPNVVYKVYLENGKDAVVTNPSEFPNGKVEKVLEPIVKATILSPTDYIGTIMELCQQRRGTLGGMDYLSEDRVEIRYTLPLAEIVFDFFDQLKSRTKGYASLDYEPIGEAEGDLVKVDILLQGDTVDAFSSIVHREKAYAYGVMMTSKLRELIPRQQFEVPIQAAIGAKIIARENIRAIRKDVLAKCYGGDITRKRKLLEKQKEGKKRMKMVGRVEVPQEAFIAALSTNADVEAGKTKK